MCGDKRGSAVNRAVRRLMVGHVLILILKLFFCVVCVRIHVLVTLGSHTNVNTYKEMGRQTGGHFTSFCNLFFLVVRVGGGGGRRGGGEERKKERVIKPRSEMNVEMWICGCVVRYVYLCMYVCT